MRQVALMLAMALTLQGAELPVRQVTLYKHGIGYFERSGDLASGESARLDFKVEEMNDVLKSLTIDVRGGGGVAGLRYDANDTLERKLAGLSLKLGDKEPISALLDQLKGARLELKIGTATIAGAIIGARVSAGPVDKGDREMVTILSDSGELQTLELAAASSLKLSDPKLQTQLKDYLAAVTQSRSQDRRSVYIDSSSAGARQVAAGYMIPMPIWKSSYRLIFPATGDAMFEGWAIVDNTSEEDWTNVNLSLISGRPISFISPLYQAKYVGREVADLADERARKPVTYGGAIGGVSGGFDANVAVGGGGGRGGRLEMAAAAPPPPKSAFQLDGVSTFNNTAIAAARELGDLFEYRFDKPITVRKSESAMLPFLQQKLTSRKIVIYSDESSQNPLNAAELTNNSGKTLDGGPITVYDGGAYAGEALMDTTKTGDKRLISYGIDLGTRITTRFDSKQSIVREIHFNRGVLTSRVASQETKTYTIRNVDAKAKTLIIEHPARPSYSLLSPKTAEKTATSYRFEVPVAAKGDQTFSVEEERVYDQTYSISSITPQQISTFIQNRQLPATARQQLETIVAKKAEIATTDAAIASKDRQTQEIFQDQQRLRENMESLNRVAGQQEQVQQYARRIATQESALATLRDQLSELRKAKSALEAELAGFIEKMSF